MLIACCGCATEAGILAVVVGAIFLFAFIVLECIRI